MIEAILELPDSVYRDIRAHLVRPNPKSEEAGFGFVAQISPNRFKFLEWRPVGLDEFVYRSLFHIELTDACRARVIKRAHDLQASLIEFHSHPISDTACFSGSDMSGFSEFVPHVWWRLKGKPYAAVVVAKSTFDSLIWLHKPTTPSGVLALAIDGHMLDPTGESIADAEDYGAREI